MVAKGRIFGDLMVSRALGDLDYKKPKQEENYVSNIPHKEKVKLNSNIHPFFILASDGLWDKLTYQEAIDMTLLHLHVFIFLLNFIYFYLFIDCFYFLFNFI